MKIYSVSRDKIEKMNDIAGDVVHLRQDKRGLVFAHITKEPVTLEDFDEFIIPPQSLSAMQAEKNTLAEKIAEIKKEAEKHYGLRPALKAHVANLELNLKYCIAQANAMDEENLTAVVGYLPVDKVEAVQSWARQNSVAIAITDPDPSETDSIPTLTAIPGGYKSSNLFLSFWGLVPGYKELDISLVFLSLFSIYFLP